ncbi:hypothetical protein ACUXCC_003456 [Cytobacillus horneckiae]|uniref:hypothetical protein n=1 Tax=Cytobacillus horneckiae TaxID=549687 RepID=UPI0019D1AB87|nr:hypothetical protein [Cytobacillus horneckiae]MBN6889919.1 hypothetical protein [Cytobacillus horneckiae]
MNLYRARLKTAGKTPEQILADYEGPNQIGPKPDEKEVNSWIQVYNILHGIEVIVAKDFVGDDYVVTSWKDEDDNKIMEYFYLAEQDPLFGTYFEEREEFLKDWKSNEYCPSATVIFAKNDVEIIEKLEKTKN